MSTVRAPWTVDRAEPAEPSDIFTRLCWYAAVAGRAPSKHNTQPWRFVVRSDGLEVWSDPSRVLPDTDPRQRELLIACGAATHLVTVAARAHGRRPRTEVFPEGRGACTSRTVEDGPWDTSPTDRRLLDAVARRRTDRGPLDASDLPPGLAFALQSAAVEQGADLRLVSTPGERATLAGLVERADRTAARSGRDRAELLPWLREPGDPRRDGVPSDHARGPVASYAAPFVQRDFSTATSVHAQDRAGPDLPLVAVLCTPTDRPADWVQAGRALAAVLLRALLDGASASYLDQPVELPAFRALLQDQLDLPGSAQLVLRLGAGGTVPPTPRRAQEDVIAWEQAT